jgi:hypothetical protein
MLMQTNSIISIEEDSFGAAKRAIDAWETALDDRTRAIGEILQLQEDLEALTDEEQALFTDKSLNESVAAKRLNETRAKRELKLAKLESVKRDHGVSGPLLSDTQIADLEREAAELEVAIKANMAEEADVFRGAGGRGLEATNRLTKLRAERDAKVARRTKILTELGSHEAAVTFRANQAREEAQRLINSLVKQLVQKRYAEAERLVDILCVDHNHKRCGSPSFASHFRSVAEARRLGRSWSDPSEARQLIEEIRAVWDLQPLAPLLRLCDTGTTEGAHACQ